MLALKDKSFSATAFFFILAVQLVFITESYSNDLSIGGYVQGQGDSVIDFETCMNAGTKFLNFRGWDLDVSSGMLDEQLSEPGFPPFADRLNDFLNGLSAHPDVIANLALTTGSNISIQPFLDNETIWPAFILELQTKIFPYLGPGKFSGVELDFEYPSSMQVTQFTKLCVQIKEALIAAYPAGTLTTITWAPPSQGNMDVQELYGQGAIDYFEPLMYAYAPNGQVQTYYMNTVDQFIPTMNEFEAGGVPFSRVIPILPLFSVIWDDVPSSDTYGLFQNGTIPVNDTTSNDTIINMILQNPALLHILPPGGPSATANCWVYVPTSATSGSFYSYIHPYISYCLINGAMQLFPSDPIRIFGYWHLNADTTTLHDTGQVIDYFGNKR